MRLRSFWGLLAPETRLWLLGFFGSRATILSKPEQSQQQQEEEERRRRRSSSSSNSSSSRGTSSSNSSGSGGGGAPAAASGAGCGTATATARQRSLVSGERRTASGGALSAGFQPPGQGFGGLGRVLGSTLGFPRAKIRLHVFQVWFE